MTKLFPLRQKKSRKARRRRVDDSEIHCSVFKSGFCFLCPPCVWQGCQIFFLVQLTKTGKNVPNNQKIYQICSHDIYQMDIKYIYPPKFTQSVIFCLKIYHLATMVCDFWCLLHQLCLCFCVKCVSPLKICPPSRWLDWANFSLLDDCFLWAIFKNNRRSPYFGAIFIHKKFFGLHFGIFIHNLIWWPCLQFYFVSSFF
jgi:hypothetical protein